MTDSTQKPRFSLGGILTGLVPVPVYVYCAKFLIDPNLPGEQGVAQMIQMSLFVLFLFTPIYLIFWRIVILKHFIPDIDEGTTIFYLFIMYVINLGLLFAGCAIGLL